MTAAAPAIQKRPMPWRLNALDWCYAREMLLPLSLGILVLVLVLAGNFVYWAINAVVNQNMSVKVILRLFLLAMPGFAVQGIPAGVILGVCLVLNRAVRDNEILALRGGGASLGRIVAPFLVVAALASLADWILVEKIAPKTNDAAEKTLARLMAQKIAPLIESDRYFNAGDYWFYVGAAQDGVLKRVMIYEKKVASYAAAVPTTFPLVYLADSAHENAQKPGEWVLENVVTHVYNADGTQFSESRGDLVRINVGQSISNFWAEDKSPFSMTSDELSKQIKTLEAGASDPLALQKKRIAFYHRFALPCACFVMALCAAPLALRYARHGSFAGLVNAFLLAFLWQGFDSWFCALGAAGKMHNAFGPAEPLVAAWATNGLFLIAGVFLLARER